MWYRHNTNTPVSDWTYLVPMPTVDHPSLHCTYPNPVQWHTFATNSQQFVRYDKRRCTFQCLRHTLSRVTSDHYWYLKVLSLLLLVVSMYKCIYRHTLFHWNSAKINNSQFSVLPHPTAFSCWFSNDKLRRLWAMGRQSGRIQSVKRTTISHFSNRPIVRNIVRYQNSPLFCSIVVRLCRNTEIWVPGCNFRG